MTTVQDQGSDKKIMAGVKDLRCVIETKVDGQMIAFIPKISVSVETDQRGIHMSRLVESVIIGWAETTKVKKVESISDNILKYILMRKDTIGMSPENIEIICKGEYIYDLMETCNVILKTSVVDGTTHSLVGVELICINACPCALSESDNQYTHTQNIVVTVFKNGGNIIELIDLIESNVTPTRTILKRANEVAVIKQAYENAMFVEDVVRKLSPFVDEVYVEAIESIHKHNATAEWRAEVK